MTVNGPVLPRTFGVRFEPDGIVWVIDQARLTVSGLTTLLKFRGEALPR